MGKTVCTEEALGEKVPANPPLSFQATILPGYCAELASAMLMPRSWLYPACEVHRSTLPLMMACELVDGVTVMVSGLDEVESRSIQVVPSLFARVYCRLLTLE